MKWPITLGASKLQVSLHELERQMRAIVGQVSALQAAVSELQDKGALPKTSKHFCNFCGKGDQEIKKLIAGPTVFICDECVVHCMDIVEGRSEGAA